MQYKVTVSDPMDLDREEIKALRRLSYRNNGFIATDVLECRRLNIGKIITVHDDKQLLGWSLLIPTKPPRGATFQGYISPYGRRKCNYEAQFYVRKACRKRGIGGILMNKAQEFGRPWVYPSSSNAGFFAKYPVSCTIDERDYINDYKHFKRRPAAGRRHR